MSKLDETSNIIELYMHHTGISEVPATFHFWCCLSMIASTVADRVGYYKFKEKRMSPNLFVMLVGPSGCGKGEAIDCQQKFIDTLARINYFRGKITGVALLDELSERAQASTQATKSEFKQSAKITLVMPELSASIGKGDIADQFIKTMTELYTGGHSKLRERTRTGGYSEVEKPCVNWLAGSTREWLIASVTRDHILSGFFGRTCTIAAQYDPNKRILEPSYPPDYDEVRKYIAARVEALTHLSGTFSMDPAARIVEREWYEQRPAPDDPALYPFFRREHDLMLKLAMIFSLADSNDLVMRNRHVGAAQDLVNRIRAELPELIEFAFTTPDTEPRNIIAGILSEAGHMQHSVLLRHVSSRGINAVRLKDAIMTLHQEKRIRILRTDRGGQYYEWIARRSGGVISK